MKIATAGNSETACFAILRKKGFHLKVLPSENELLQASKDGHKYIAESAIDLLGLVYMYELRGRDWKPSDEELDDFLAFNDANYRQRN